MDGDVRAVLVGAGEDRYLEELASLARTLGVEVVGTLEQSRRDPVGYLGNGKRAELRSLVEEGGAGMVITDDELSASQARALERDCGASVVDRTELIIRIFEAHARDRASKLEVELADLEYRLPRVKGRNEALSRLGGGVGTRGPGEQQLEYDRRLIRNRMRTIRRRLEQERRSRRVRRESRERLRIPSVSLVGYTNAGKTTLLNALSSSEGSTADRLFETLETSTRIVRGTEGNPDILMTDTVGFIRKLPTQLVHSFESTLEAAADADVLVVCADASSPFLDEEVAVVRETLSGLDPAPEEEDVILCLNKIDRLKPHEIKALKTRYPSATLLSALRNPRELLDRIYSRLSERMERLELLIPHSDYQIVSTLYERAIVHSQKPLEGGTLLDVSIPDQILPRYSRYRIA
ncbi:GTPase HflX [Rubrobacter naiadicus]|uniref:GTPase HflX n=1 Tax=Rubrobacter naiadicus TaxID=1392641 RepID=UPI0023616338|nr:GTPase HflX [Rubrobacter naiadicus]